MEITPPTNFPIPVPNESVKLNMEKILPLSCGSLTFNNIIFTFELVNDASNDAKNPKIDRISIPEDMFLECM